MDEKNVLLFVSFWMSLFILFLGLSSKVLCLECLGVLDRSLIVLLCVLSSFEGGKLCVDLCEELEK